ncbi:MAG TPA: hypothetical protein VGF39_15820 [Stellaceae bacterium]
MNLIACGHYKHVRAFGYVHECDAYLFYDVQLGGTVLQLARGDGARALMTEWAASADVLVIEKLGISPSPIARFFQPLLCTTAIAHLLGLPGALPCLRPDALYRACLKNGAIPVGGCHGAADYHDQRSHNAVEGG